MGGPEMVMCSKHKKLRLKSYCQEIPVRNASMEIVSYAYECLPTSVCHTTSAPTGAVIAAGTVASAITAGSTEDISLNTIVSPNSANTTGSAGFNTDRIQFNDKEGGEEKKANAKGRYYDLSKQEGRDRVVGKTCFQCGQDDHERSNCPNQVCRSCHMLRKPRERHICEHPTDPSPFVTTVIPTAEELAQVRCVSCHELGHIDCRPKKNPSKSWTPSCSWCGMKGHNAFSCPNTPTDPWVDANTPGAPRHRGGGGGGGYQNNGGGRGGDRHGDRDGGCFKCGEFGHIARDCPNQREERRYREHSRDRGYDRQRGRDRGYDQDEDEYHNSRYVRRTDDNRNRQYGGGGGGGYGGGHGGSGGYGGGHGGRQGGGGHGGDKCFKCGEPGHFSRDCPYGGGGGGRSARTNRSRRY